MRKRREFPSFFIYDQLSGQSSIFDSITFIYDYTILNIIFYKIHNPCTQSILRGFMHGTYLKLTEYVFLMSHDCVYT